MSANQASFPLAAMARVLGVSKAGYYAWLQRPASAHAMADAALLKRVRTIVNAGEKMHRRAGVKMHHGQRRRIVAGAWRSTGQGQPKLSLPVRSMNQLSRPDLASPDHGAQRRGWEERSHAQHREHGEHRTFPAVSTVAG